MHLYAGAHTNVRSVRSLSAAVSEPSFPHIASFLGRLLFPGGNVAASLYIHKP